jgi:hypothetical protein
MKVSVVLIVILLGLQHVQLRANGTVLAPNAADDIARSPTTLQEAQRFFYNGDYDTAATATLALCTARPDDLAACELPARDFPENRELRRFLTIHAPTAVMTSPGHNAP